ncbi:MAG: S-adenosylmethionine:tRNA ribosyltransferase-isomerase [Polyangiaceae bacterium]
MRLESSPANPLRLAKGTWPTPKPPSPHLAPATRPKARSERERLLVVDASTGAIADRLVPELPDLLAPGDLLVVNDAATLPAAVWVTLGSASLELRVESLEDDAAWVIAFGAGDSSIPTEARGAPPKLSPGDELAVAGTSQVARVLEVDAASPRRVRIAFESARAALVALYARGRPIQYAYVDRALELWDVATSYASRPWASELASAGRPLRWSLLGELRRRGVELARVTHAASLSSTGDPALDAALPRAERYRIDEDAALAIHRAKARGGRVIAVGTSTTRALESAARATRDGAVAAREGVSALRIGPNTELLVVDMLLTGMHEPGTSHFELLEAFADRPLLDAATLFASSRGYRQHEFGDSMLIASARAGRVEFRGARSPR